MKIIYEISETRYEELKNENWYGCDSFEQYIKEMIIEDPDLICNADIEINFSEGH